MKGAAGGFCRLRCGVKDGFCLFGDVSLEYLTEPENGQAGGRLVLKVGQEIIVQAVREANGNKGAPAGYPTSPCPDDTLFYFPINSVVAYRVKSKAKKTGKKSKR